MDLAQATGVPEPVELAGQDYPVRLLTMREWAALSSWLKKESPSPVTRAAQAIKQARLAGEPFDIATEKALLDHAQQAALNWPPRIGSSEWFEAISRVDGGDVRLLYEVLSKTDLGFTLEKAEALAPRIDREEWADLVRVSFYGTHPVPKPTPAPASTSAPVSPSPTNGTPLSSDSTTSTGSIPVASAT